MPGLGRALQVQTVLGIFDLRGFTSANADWGFVRFLVDIFFLYYPKASRQQGIAAGCPQASVLLCSGQAALGRRHVRCALLRARLG